jgi:hypothetical protein
MNKLIQALSVLILAVIFSVATASAQTVTKVQAEIPHNFNLGAATFAAGSYEMRIAKDESGGAVISLVSVGGQFLKTVLGRQSGAATEGSPVLQFENRNGIYYLTNIVTRTFSYAIAAADPGKNPAGFEGGVNASL